MSSRIGISGWTYVRWCGLFYPGGLPHAKELHFASRQPNTIEVNETFNRMQRQKNFASWLCRGAERLPLCDQGRRFITHVFDKDRKVHSTFDAQRLAELVSERPQGKEA